MKLLQILYLISGKYREDDENKIPLGPTAVVKDFPDAVDYILTNLSWHFKDNLGYWKYLGFFQVISITLWISLLIVRGFFFIDLIQNLSSKL